MKSIYYAVLTAAVLSAPVVAFAQSSNAPVTREQVKAEIVQLQKVGYNNGDTDAHYPDAILAAEARVAQMNASTVANQAHPVAVSSYGPSANGSSQSGGPAVRTDRSLYSGH